MDKHKVFDYHWTRTLKTLQDELDKAKTTKQKVEIATAIDRLLMTEVDQAKVVKMRTGWEDDA